MSKRSFAVIFAALVMIGPVFAGTVEENWNDFLHYLRIGRLELAKGYGQQILDSNPDPQKLLSLSQDNQTGYEWLIRAKEQSSDSELVSIGEKVLAIIEKGRYQRRTDPKIIVGEINRLSGPARGKLAAVDRLGDSGEYAIPYMLEAIADPAREIERPNIIWALPKIGKEAIRPLTAALQSDDVAVKAEIIKALGEISYPQATPYLKYVVENSDSEKLRQLASKSIQQINPASLDMPAAVLFYRLAESYYYHQDSLQPKDDFEFANMWFWDSSKGKLQREEVDRDYFNELMAMRSCEWSLRADSAHAESIGLWVGSFYKAESTGNAQPEYFGEGHGDAMMYATTAGAQYVHQALARALKDKNSYVALGATEALVEVAGEKTLFDKVADVQPLSEALAYKDKAVQYSAAIAVAAGDPQRYFPEKKMVVENLAKALSHVEGQQGNPWRQDPYDLRAVTVMKDLAESRNPVIDLSVAQSSLVDAAKSARPEIQILACRTLAALSSPQAQRAIARVGLDEENQFDIRVKAFNSLAISAKQNGNLLDSGSIGSIYLLIHARSVDPQLRQMAASAYGALNLPSQKVKELILDQAKK